MTATAVAPGRGPIVRRGAATALLVSAVLCASVVAQMVPPPAWLAAERAASVLPPTALLPSDWAPLANMLPLGELATRNDMLAAAFVIAVGTAATWGGYHVFRGSGRWLAAVVAGPIATAANLHWLHREGPLQAMAVLPSTLMAALGITAAVRSLVLFGHVTVLARTRALAAGAMAMLFSPRLGAPVLAALAVLCLLRSRTRSRQHPEDAGPLPPEGTRPSWLQQIPSVLVAIVPPAAMAAWLTATGHSWPEFVRWPLELRFDVERIAEDLPAFALYPGAVLIVLLVLPLRWRGGASLVLLGFGGLVVHDAQGPLIATPLLLVLFSTASAGWVWLSGTVMGPHRPRAGRLVAGWTAVIALAITVGSTFRERRVKATVAELRPAVSVIRVYEKGLIAPGDAWLVHSPWLTATLNNRRRTEGWRPDVATEDVRDVDGRTLLAVTFAFDEEGRRVLSDSFTGGGRWLPTWLIDSGPLFWFVGEQSDYELDFTDLDRFFPPLGDLSPQERQPWLLMAIERARFRRAIGYPEQALSALPLATLRHRSLRTRLQLARSSRAHAGEGSELPPLVDRAATGLSAAVDAEAGDLLFAHGERERAAAILAEAGDDGFAPALGALARWQLRSGEVSAARATMAALHGSEPLRREAVELLWWLLSRDRVAEAKIFVDTTSFARNNASQAIAARLSILDALAKDPPPPDQTPAPRFSRRR